MQPAEVKATVKREYGAIAQLTDERGQAWQRDHICKPIFDPIADVYPQLDGYEDEANLGLGCDQPTRYLHLKAGERVVDLGCAAGVDSFIARRLVGDDGRITGIDLTPELLERARSIAARRRLTNMTFICADIEQLPIPDATQDAAMSNGVFSLITDKAKAFAEIHRVLRSGGRFCICDLVRRSDIPEAILADTLAFTGCLNGIYELDAYEAYARAAGFEAVTAAALRPVATPFAADGSPLVLWAAALTGLKK